MSTMGKTLKYILMAFFVTIAVSTAIVRNTISQKLTNYEGITSGLFYGEQSTNNGKNIAFLNAIQNDTPFLITTQDNPVPSFLRAGQKNNHHLQFKQDLIGTESYLYIAYKSTLRSHTQHYSLLRSKGHYLYSLCKLLI